jgi:hypothetical protein
MLIILRILLFFVVFYGRLVAKKHQQAIPYDLAFIYVQYMRYLSLWFASVL